ncbi:MotA/TolQ/ExbB proton channel family protein [bacterium]|nr:MotA/TolQ/ExbB proton channel family protein [bacterium]
MGFFQFIIDNFLHAAPVLIAALFAIAITIERSRSLLKTYPMKDTKAFMDRISDYVNRNETAQAVAMCDQHLEKPVAKVVKTALLRSHLPDEAIEQGINIALGETNDSITKRTPYLATIANVATLMGLFGTILGLIQSFQAVANADPAMKSQLLSAGISTSMNATMLGLGVAIPCMVVYAFLTNKANKLQSEVDDAALRCTDTLRMRYFRPQNNQSKNLEGVA